MSSPDDSSTTSVTITVNGEQNHLTGPITVADYLDQQGYDPQGVSVAINGDVVPGDAWANRSLTDGLDLNIVTLTPGG
ncbi:sulfur carrier protein ThiS [Streptomyces sp. NPDC049813]|uniref:sulfur carrier protein ThiS n=1 Tax=Streptomyces sp. NPDC049813 TaxID=3365597 RepID=UPI0037A98086